ncbi:MAG: VWA domain-containing protein [Sporomusaceae bacterium]|jgi:uncharacterized protein with von Willebrand factor type A (vWA) domain|nr:VWA domain-containing protein [Sporomusaceae bacterium]
MSSLADSIIGFVQILRQLGVRVSIAEALDAAEGLQAIDFLDRSQFKAALKGTLIKNAQDRASFEKAFQLFFISADEKKKREAAWDTKLQNAQEETAQAEEELVFQGRQLEIPEELKDVYKMLPVQDKKSLQDFLEKTSAGNKVDEKFQPVVEHLLINTLSFRQKRLSPEDLELLERARRELTGRSDLDNVIDAAQAGGRGTGQNPLLAKNLRDIEETEIPQLMALIKRMAYKLSSRISRRFRLSAKKDAVDIRRSIRRNMRYGGTMLSLKYKTKKIKKPSIIILCDVSASMTKYARFTLPLLYGLANIFKNIESFIFATELEKATIYFRGGTDFTKAIENILANSGQIGEGTNIFAALSDLRLKEAKLTKSTLLFIISDANTLKPRETALELKIVNEKVKKIIWLNTQPKNTWSQNAAIGEFAKNCAMFECYTLAHLAKILAANI